MKVIIPDYVTVNVVVDPGPDGVKTWHPIHVSFDLLQQGNFKLVEKFLKDMAIRGHEKKIAAYEMCAALEDNNES